MNAIAKSSLFAVGQFSFATPDARQWADWGIDYLKYDWNPIETPQVKEMADALNNSGRDVVYSLSNQASMNVAADLAPSCKLLAYNKRHPRSLEHRSQYWFFTGQVGFIQRSGSL